ncbi:nucleoredoxin-like protein 1 [Oncorhynchus kisutch]|uniref:nucleoredoxin-like protein 1 n=1 Tax=Oncorhynchus kisutch TaxID=8019 RepID=UPI0012DFC51B|nr:nucleoredoxin-like protein 1 [Oncorhynchus kisutch]
MVDLFLGRSLVCNNRDRVEYDTEREVILRLQNRILLLFFGSVDSQRCKEFVPTLKDFFKRLTDEFYVERSAQLVLLYISLDQSEEQLENLLKELPKKCLFLTHNDPYRRELESMFEVEDVPRVVVLRPDCSVLSPNAVSEISSLGTNCFHNWQESAELIDRNFMLNEEFDDKKMRSVTDPIRRLKYKVKKKKRRRWGWANQKGVLSPRPTRRVSSDPSAPGLPEGCPLTPQPQTYQKGVLCPRPTRRVSSATGQPEWCPLTPQPQTYQKGVISPRPTRRVSSDPSSPDLPEGCPLTPLTQAYQKGVL